MLICTASFFFNDTATTEIYTLSLHDALPICPVVQRPVLHGAGDGVGHVRVERDALLDGLLEGLEHGLQDRKSTRLNSSHANISYAVFCLKKKTHTTTIFQCNKTRYTQIPQLI